MEYKVVSLLTTATVFSGCLCAGFILHIIQPPKAACTEHPFKQPSNELVKLIDRKKNSLLAYNLVFSDQGCTFSNDGSIWASLRASRRFDWLPAASHQHSSVYLVESATDVCFGVVVFISEWGTDSKGGLKVAL
ncbi:hypothetical protein HAX54_025793 [Datura stramonium]|uniref:Uncharacterized protein n=1 Tax=Datura stramonium TaxID=4076 RepID=A0ABS8S7L9_DATST|nr:hypothetical protein [Datura stramonium]